MCTFAIVIKTQTTMTKKQYQELSENFWRYGDIQVDYFLPTPSGKKMESFGFLRGIGVGVNAESIIIASCGFRHAIHYSNVNFPKSNRNFQIMYRVIFYKEKTDFRGNISMERISLDSGCITLTEAFSFAVNNGADPNKDILYKWIEQ